MITSYIQAGLVRLLRLGGGLALQTKQVRDMPPASHRQPLRYPTDADGGLGAQLGSQFHFVAALSQTGQEHLAVIILPKDLLLVVAAVHHVVDRPGDIGCAACEP